MTATPQLMQRALIAAAGASLVLAAVTARGALFVRPWFLPVLAGAGVLLAAAAVRGGARVDARATALLLVPLIAAVALPPGQAAVATFSASAKTSNVGARFGDPDNPLLAGRGGDVTLLQVRGAEQQLGAVALAGRQISATGFVSAPGAVSRLAMVCCAADARPVTLPVTGGSLVVGQWVTVHGRLTVVNGELMLEADSARRVRVPAEPIL